MKKKTFKFINRDISWLSFNERVIQEAADERNPLVERLRFLGIFSNNGDEFFRVRVPSIKRKILIKDSLKDYEKGDPALLLEEIQKIIFRQQKKFTQIYSELINALKKEGIFLLTEKELNEEQKKFVTDYFTEAVSPYIIPIMLDSKSKFPTLTDKVLYLAVKMFKTEDSKKQAQKPQYAILQIPEHLPRFISLPIKEETACLILIDDVIRHSIHEIFHSTGFDNLRAFTIKLTRDAEFELDNDFSQTMLEKMKKALKKQKKGEPIRFVYDETMDEDMLKYLKQKINLGKSDSLMPGGRCHNFKDFINFPNYGGKHLEFEKFHKLRHQDLPKFKNIFDTFKAKDLLLHHPYQSFSHFIEFLRSAAIDPKVVSIKVTLYRLAKGSKVINALISAIRNGKEVTVIIELKARFDEEANIHWANVLEEEGAKVSYGVKDLKVHCKLCLVSRKEGKILRHYASIGTGNFNEVTSKIYGDTTLFTSEKGITNDVINVFNILEGKVTLFLLRNLLLSPLFFRKNLIKMINTEIRNAKAGNEAWIDFKMNNLVDREIIEKLYEAGQAGVKIRLIVRGTFCLIAGKKGLSENIEAISIIDRFLEHTRIYFFANNGSPKIFIGSADLMNRNLDRRVEVTCPIHDKSIQEELRYVFDTQWSDNVKARILDKKLKNHYAPDNGNAPLRSQYAIYEYYKNKCLIDD